MTLPLKTHSLADGSKSVLGETRWATRKGRVPRWYSRSEPAGWSGATARPSLPRCWASPSAKAVFIGRIAAAAGHNGNSGLEANIANLELQRAPYPLAHARCVELAAARNCIAHNQQTWQAGQINRLVAVPNFQYPIPTVGQSIEVELSHLLVYRCSGRQLLNL